VRAFEVVRHRDENEVTSLGACIVQVSLLVLRGWGWGDSGISRGAESLGVQGLGLPWLGSKPRCRGEAEEAGELKDAIRANASAAASWF